MSDPVMSDQEPLISMSARDLLQGSAEVIRDQLQSQRSAADRSADTAEVFCGKITKTMQEKSLHNMYFPEHMAGMVFEAKLAENKISMDEVNSIAEKAADFMLNVGVVCTLLVSVQIGVAMSEAEPWPLLAWFANTYLDNIYMGTVTLAYDEFYKSTSASADHKWIAEEPIEINIFITLLQQASTLWLLWYMLPNLLIIAKSTKAYGHLTWWTAGDPSAMRMFLDTPHIQQFQGQMNGLLPNFCISMCPYLLLTRGPIVALAVYAMSRYIRAKYRHFDATGQGILYEHFSRRILSGEMFKKT